MSSSEERFRIIESSITDLITRHAPDGTFLYVSPSSSSILGFDPAELVDRNIFEFIHPDDMEEVENLFDRFVISSSVILHHFRIRNKQGKYIWIEANGRSLQDNSIDVYYEIICVSRDISERKRFEEALVHSERKNKALLRAIPDLFLKLNRKGVCLDYHFHREKDLSIFKGEILGKSIEEILPHSVASRVMFYLEKAYLTGRTQIFEFSHKSTQQYFEIRIVSSEEEEIIAIIRDISERKEIEAEIENFVDELHKNQESLRLKTEELERLNDQLAKSELKLQELNANKDKFFSIIAHDLRSPFTSVLGFSEYISKNFNELSRDEIGEYSTHMNNATKNVFNLLENLLHWSRIQTGRVEFTPEPFSLSALIYDVFSVYKIIAGNKKIELVNKIENDIQVYADRQMVDTIVRNLLSNGIKFTHPDNKVVIQCRVKEGYVEVSVKDTGVGISSERIKHLFKIDQFKSTDGTDKEKGTGLGLILCKEFVEKCGGKLWVKSELDKGSTFYFTLPSEKTA